MNPHTTALLLIEFRNDFVSEGGTQHDAVKAVMAGTNMPANARAVAYAARRGGATVPHAFIGFADGYPEMPAKPCRILAGIRTAGAFRRGSWGAAFAEAMAPARDRVVLDGKRGPDCFASTNVDFIPRQRGVTDLAIAGMADDDAASGEELIDVAQAERKAEVKPHGEEADGPGRKPVAGVAGRGRRRYRVRPHDARRFGRPGGEGSPRSRPTGSTVPGRPRLAHRQSPG